jgi:hypothetical protein
MQENVLGNGIKLLGEVMVPGAAEMLEGKLGSGVAHNLVAGAATLALAPVSPLLAGLAVLAVKLNSYSRSVVGRSLFATVSSAVSAGDGGGATDASASPAAARPAGRSGAAGAP